MRRKNVLEFHDGSFCSLYYKYNTYVLLHDKHCTQPDVKLLKQTESNFVPYTIFCMYTIDTVHIQYTMSI